jgi:hypothetical protein
MISSAVSTSRENTGPIREGNILNPNTEPVTESMDKATVITWIYMYMYIYICMYIYVYIYICLYVRIYRGIF